MSIEDKTYSLSMHFRESSAPHHAKELVLRVTAQLTPLPRLVLGKAVVNVIPPGTPHKGTALLELMRQLKCEAALYVGDDDTDEDVFSLPDERSSPCGSGKRPPRRPGTILKRNPRSSIYWNVVSGSYESRHIKWTRFRR